MSSDARTVRTRGSVLRATGELLLEVGCERITIDEIANRSGVARSTIYRNWEDRSALLIEAVDCVAEMPEPPDTGTLEGDLTIMADRLSKALSEGALGRLLPSLVGAGSCDPSLADRLHRMADGRLLVSRPVFERAVARGEIDADDLDGRIERFMSPFFVRHLLHGWEFDADFKQRQVRAAAANVPGS